MAVVSLGTLQAPLAQPVVRLSAEWAGLRKTASEYGRSTIGAAPLRSIAAGTYDVVALRVEFQPDSSRYTTGDGTFDGPLFADGLEASIDPLPHDADYFEAHLAFLEHYVSTVSHGRVDVRTHLLPDVVRVSGRMGDYSPTGPGADSAEQLSKLAALAREAWTLAPPAPGLPPLSPQRTAFVVFHAGVGRDIELVGTTLDKTPEDLPSLYFDGAALDRLAPGPAPAIGGMAVGNTMLIPRTESRQGFDFIADEPFLAEFSINGMLAASFLNFLGAPDLFDTDSGESAIGPFGLMDGQGIFAMSGLFPPRPSAWTRTWLGWADPQVVSAIDPTEVTLSVADPGVALVPVSDGEYFLAEVRHRDPGGSGVRLTVWRDGTSTETVFANGDEGFNPQSVEAFPGGVVTAVEPYDFALPGGLDEDGDPLLGGVLIWHVDERMLARGLPTNRVNADPARRAVDLEEADGAQDIGYPTGGFFGPAFHLGSPFDFWYAGNPVSVITSSGNEVTLYENRFGPDTVPSSASNGGGDSFVEIGEFSEAGPTMTLVVRRVGGDGLSIDPDWSRVDDLFPVTRGWYGDGGVLKPAGDGFLEYAGAPTGLSRIRVVAHPYEGPGSWDAPAAAGAEPANLGSSVYVVHEAHSGGPFTLQVISGWSTDLGYIPPGTIRRATTPVVRTNEGHLYVGVVGDQGPRLLQYRDRTLTALPEDEPLVSLALTPDGNPIVIGRTRTRLDAAGADWTYAALPDSVRLRPIFGSDRDGVFGAITNPVTNRLHLLRQDLSVVTLDVGNAGVYAGGDVVDSGIPGDLSAFPSMADLDADGLLDVLVGAGSTLWAFNRSGAVVSGFPLALRAPLGPGPPLVTRFTESGGATIVVGAADGRIDAYDLGARGRQVPGFPLSAGRGPSIAPMVHEGRLWAVSSDGGHSVWVVNEDAPSAQHLVDGGNSSFVVLPIMGPPEAPPASLLLDSETYNWPNPVQGGGGTWIRFQVTEPASVTIRILDLVGRLVDRLDVSTPDVGIPVEIRWDADVPSGVYTARVRAVAPTGASFEKLVKIAVIR